MAMLCVGSLRRKELKVISYQRWCVESVYYCNNDAYQFATHISTIDTCKHTYYYNRTLHNNC